MRPEPEMGARRLISGTGSKRLTGAKGVEDIGKQTRLDPMETVRPGKSRSDTSGVSSREAEKISLSHEAKQARYICNIRRSLSHEAKQTRYTSGSVWVYWTTLQNFPRWFSNLGLYTFT